MVKSPGPKHSKPRREPVTIDLDPKEVERKPAAAENNSPGTAASAQEGGAAATPTSDTGAPEPKAAGAKAQESQAASVTASSESGAKATADSAEAARARADATGTTARESAHTSSSVKPETAKGGPATDRKATGPSVTPAGAGAAGGSTPPPGTRSGGSAAPRRGTALLAGLAGGLIALLLVAVLQWAGMWPLGTPARGSAELAELRLQVDELRQTVAAGEPALTSEDLDARIGEAVEAGVSPLREELGTLQGNVADGGGEPVDLQPLQERLETLEASIAALRDEGSPDAALAGLDERFATLEARLEAAEADASPDEELAARLDGLEQNLAAVQAELGERADEPRAALVIAVSALKAAIDRGDGFQTELETYAALTPDAESAAALGAYAAGGVPTRNAILAELPPAADRMAAAGREREEGDDFLGNLWQSARDLVAVRPIGSVEGDSVEAIVARLEAAVRDGEYGRALAEYDTLPPAAQSAGADFMEGVRARHEADTLMDEALTRALRAS